MKQMLGNFRNKIEMIGHQDPQGKGGVILSLQQHYIWHTVEDLLVHVIYVCLLMYITSSSLCSRYLHTINPDLPFSGQYFTTWQRTTHIILTVLAS